MNTLSYKTISVSKQQADKKFVVIDADGQVLGRVASKIASVMRGKHKPSFTPHADTGDNVIVINADKVVLTGDKWTKKEYVRHTGFPGGQRITTAQELKNKSSILLIRNAVRGMLPKNKLGRAVLKNLHVFEGAEHTHEAQKPETIEL